MNGLDVIPGGHRAIDLETNRNGVTVFRDLRKIQRDAARIGAFTARSLDSGIHRCLVG
jgi:hypothetical protein